MKKLKGLSIVLTAVVAINSFAFSKNAAAADAQENTKAKLVSIQQDNKVNGSYGYIPSGIKVKKGDKYYKSAQMPPQYDLRSSGYVTPIRNQGSLPSCWTFSTYGSLESVEKKKDGQTYDFSEINMVTHNEAVAANEGGNNIIASAYLVAWKGPVFESDDPYPNPADLDNITVTDGIPARYHVQDIIYLPSRSSSTDNQEIKNAIIQYGAVSSSYYHDDSYYIDKGQASYYCDRATKGNHAITIIGWDDNFAQSNFLKQPPGPGAFLCKNSWGDDWGDNGYYYISYYDANLGTDSNAVFNGLESKDNYNNMYSNTDKPQDKYYYNAQNAGNKYIAKGDEVVSAVGFYTFAQDVSYEVYIDKLNGSTVNKPFNMVSSGSLSQGGYHTIKLDNKVKVSNGEQFMIWIKLIGDNYWGSSDSSAVNSYYIDSDGIGRAEIAFGINAYTINYDASSYVSIASEDPSNGELTMDKPITLTYSDNISVGSGYNNISLKDENNVDVSKSVTISGNKLTVKETPQNHLNGQLKLYVPKDAVKNAAGKYNYSDYNKTFNVYAADSTIVKFQNSALENAIRKQLNKLSGNITAYDMKKIEELNLYGLGLNSLSGLEYAVNMETLKLEYNHVVSLAPLKYLRNLRELNLYDNEIKDISMLSNLTGLETLDISYNHIRDITPLHNLKRLSSLGMSGNLITNISIVADMTSLSDIAFRDNLVKDITSLENLIIRKNNSDLSLSMGDNYIDFSEGSKATHTRDILNKYNVFYYGDTYQKTGLNVVEVNGHGSFDSAINALSGEKIVIEFNSPIKLEENAGDYISMQDQSNNLYKTSVKAVGNYLIITPIDIIKSFSYVTIGIGSGVVINCNDESEVNTSKKLYFYIDSDRYGDFNNDKKVTVLDLAQLSSQYNKTIDSAAVWDSSKDLNKDGVIDIYDFAALSNYIN